MNQNCLKHPPNRTKHNAPVFQFLMLNQIKTAAFHPIAQPAVKFPWWRGVADAPEWHHQIDPAWENYTDPLNTLRPRQNGHHFADDIFNCIFLNENVWILIKISLKFVPKNPINNIPALVQIMAWRRPGDKPLSEPMMVNLLTHICVTRSQSS